MNEKKHTLLVIDDDTLFCHTISDYFDNRDMAVVTAGSGREGLGVCARMRVDVVLLDQKLPDARGADLCDPILARNDGTKIIFITAFPSFNNAVGALKAGAHDYLSKPFELAELEMALQRALRTQGLERIEQLERCRSRMNGDCVLVGRNAGMAEVQRLVDLAARNTASVLITGATGTGKGNVANSIHYRAHGSSSGFIGINCGAFPENLMEAELFGYEKGAFTGATVARKGIFEMAEGGTLFLDEIGEIPFHLQSRLLGVLDDNRIRRIGSQASRAVNVRIIAATNMNLERAVREKKFREDLYYRLGVLRIHMPPLKEHAEDIPDLCGHFIKLLANDGVVRLPDAEMARLKHYGWPGNIRELRNILERAIMLRKGRNIYPASLLRGNGPDAAGDSPAPAPVEKEKLMSLREVEEKHIRFVLEKLGRNHTHTARTLGISRSTLMRKLKGLGAS